MSIIFNLLTKRWRELIILLLVCIILFLRGCGTDYGDKQIIKVDGKDYELLEQKIDTVFVEKTVKVPTYVPKYIEKIVTETVEVEIPIDVDSLAIIKDYFSKYQVKDTLNLTYDFPSEVTDSIGNKPSGDLGYGILTDVISQNKIESRQIDWFFKIPTVYNTTIVKELPKNELYYGLGGGFSNQDYTLTGNILFKTKKSKIFGISAGITNQLIDIDLNTRQSSPYFGAQLYWKLGKK